MAIVRALRAVRPIPEAAHRVAAVPYDVVDADEARALAAPEPLSFLHVSRAEIDLPPDTDPHSDTVYNQAARRYRQLKRDAPLLQEAVPAIYAYRLSAGGHSQTGVAACYSLDDYDRDVIRKHERTRRDKEDDRTRHIIELRAQTGPVFLTYKPLEVVKEITKRTAATVPLFDFTAIDGVRHTVWSIEDEDVRSVIEAFAGAEALYIADGHHRAASAARARAAVFGSTEADYFLAVAFPSDQVRILPYNRVVKDLNGHTPAGLLGDLARRGFTVKNGPPEPEEKGLVSMYVDGGWYFLDLESTGAPGPGIIEALDCNLLQERVLGPVFGIGDIRTDPRIDFVGGARGTKALEQLVDAGKAAVAFSMYPVSVQELMAVSDEGSIMPPKSTWFEPKLRDGLLIHEI
jgi:uncharacterized protein (DUF1015 family)